MSFLLFHLGAAKPLKFSLSKLQRAQKRFSRKKKGSSNVKKAISRLQKVHQRIANPHSECLHQLTETMTSNISLIGIEDLNVKGTMDNRQLPWAISDVRFHEFRRQLECKSRCAGSKLALVDCWFPSSKTCSVCREVNKHLT